MFKHGIEGKGGQCRVEIGTASTCTHTNATGRIARQCKTPSNILQQQKTANILMIQHV